MHMQETSAHCNKDAVHLSSRRDKASPEQSGAGAAGKEQHEGKSRAAV